MRRRQHAIGIVAKGGCWFLFRMKPSGPVGEPVAGPFATRLDAEQARTQRMLRPARVRRIAVPLARVS